MEKDLIGAMSCTHELKWNEIFKFGCSGPRLLVADLSRRHATFRADTAYGNDRWTNGLKDKRRSTQR